MRRPNLEDINFSRELALVNEAQQRNFAEMRDYGQKVAGHQEWTGEEKTHERLIYESWLLLALLEAMSEGDFTRILTFARVSPDSWHLAIELLYADVEDPEELNVRIMTTSNKLNKAHAPLHTVYPP